MVGPLLRSGNLSSRYQAQLVLRARDSLCVQGPAQPQVPLGQGSATRGSLVPPCLSARRGARQVAVANGRVCHGPWLPKGKRKR